MGFVYPLVLLCVVACIIIGCVISVFSLSIGPGILSVLSYLLFQGSLGFGLISLGDITILMLGGEISAALQATLLLDVLVLLFSLQWYLGHRKQRVEK